MRSPGGAPPPLLRRAGKRSPEEEGVKGKLRGAPGTGWGGPRGGGLKPAGRAGRSAGRGLKPAGRAGWGWGRGRSRTRCGPWDRVSPCRPRSGLLRVALRARLRAGARARRPAGRRGGAGPQRQGLHPQSRRRLRRRGVRPRHLERAAPPGPRAGARGAARAGDARGAGHRGVRARAGAGGRDDPARPGDAGAGRRPGSAARPDGRTDPAGHRLQPPALRLQPCQHAPDPGPGGHGAHGGLGGGRHPGHRRRAGAVRAEEGRHGGGRHLPLPRPGGARGAPEPQRRQLPDLLPRPLRAPRGRPRRRGAALHHRPLHHARPLPHPLRLPGLSVPAVHPGPLAARAGRGGHRPGAYLQHPPRRGRPAHRLHRGRQHLRHGPQLWPPRPAGRGDQPLPRQLREQRTRRTAAATRGRTRREGRTASSRGTSSISSWTSGARSSAGGAS